MIKIEDLVNKALLEGYQPEMAKAKVCQDIILKLLQKSKIKNNITIKGGVVMRSLSNNIRRSTLDIDVDLIHYPLTIKHINYLITSLNANDEGIYLKIVGKPKPLHHQNYHGLRINIKIKDSLNASNMCKMDIGVHKYLDLKQKEYCFDIDLGDKGVVLLVNSKEQMFTEKLKSLLIFGIATTRFKDIFDMYYLMKTLDINELNKCFDVLIFNDNKIKQNTIKDIYLNVKTTFNSNLFMKNFNLSKNNWINIDTSIVLSGITNFLKKLI